MKQHTEFNIKFQGVYMDLLNSEVVLQLELKCQTIEPLVLYWFVTSAKLEFLRLNVQIVLPVLQGFCED